MNNNDNWPLTYRIAAIWLIYVVWATAGGWTLSAFNRLNLYGYLLALPFLVIGWIWFWRSTDSSHSWGGFSKFKKYLWWKRPEAVVWFAALILIGIGGALYAPSNYDSLTFRLPRILYWWQSDGWHWVGSVNDRQDFSGTVLEWQMLPILIFTKSDRLLFLINFIPFALFPFLAFPALRILGVSRNTAAVSMWILPLAYGFALQAGSIGNDGLGGVLVVASLAFASRASKGGTILPLTFSCFAIAALTGLKTSNLPLVLPLCFYWIFQAVRCLKVSTIPKLIPWVAIAGLCSFLPTAILNQIHCGNWGGDPQNLHQVRVMSPLPGLLGNSIYLLADTLQPPLMPIAKKLDQSVFSDFNQGNFVQFIQSGFPRFTMSSGGEIPMEEAAGLGAGIALFVFVLFLLRKRRTVIGFQIKVLWAASFVAACSFMLLLASEATARLMLPYLLLLLTPMLSMAGAIHYSWKLRWLSLIPFFFILPALILSPARPLFPAQQIGQSDWIPAGIRNRIQSVYSTYANRFDMLGDLRQQLPPAVDEVFFAGSNDQSSVSLFRPYGSRKVFELTEKNFDSAEWIVGTATGLEQRTGVELNSLIENRTFERVSKVPVTTKVSAGEEDWYIIRRLKNHHE